MYGPDDISAALARWEYVDVKVNTRVPRVKLPVYSSGQTTVQTLHRSMHVEPFKSGVSFYQLGECFWIPWLAIVSITNGTLCITRPLRVRPRRFRLIKGKL